MVAKSVLRSISAACMRRGGLLLREVGGETQQSRFFIICFFSAMREHPFSPHFPRRIMLPPVPTAVCRFISRSVGESSLYLCTKRHRCGPQQCCRHSSEHCRDLPVRAACHSGHTVVNTKGGLPFHRPHIQFDQIQRPSLQL